MVSMFPADLMDRLGEELRDACMGLSPKAEGREVPWVQRSVEGELWPSQGVLVPSSPFGDQG